MRIHDRQRGLTLIESMAALCVMLIGAVGIAGLFSTGVRMNGDARRMTRATAIAQDLLNSIELWPYQEVALQNSNAANDADIGDVAQTFEADAPPPADHTSADLPAAFVGIPTAQLGTEFERYWNVAYPITADNDANGNGVADSAHISVIVRWRVERGWRRIVLLATKPNPVEH